MDSEQQNTQETATPIQENQGTGDTPQNISSPPPSPPQAVPYKAIIMTLLIVIVGLIGYIIYSTLMQDPAPKDTFGGNIDAISNDTSMQENASDNTSTSTPVPTQAPAFATFTDSKLEGFAMDYDPQEWTIEEFNTQDALPEGVEKGPAGHVLKASHGNLYLIYKYPLPVGGVISTITADEYKKVTSEVSRFYEPFRTGKYIYGFETPQSITHYAQDPASKESILQNCGKPTPLQLSDEECTQIRNGTIIGHVELITFVRSMTWKKTVPLSEFAQPWSDPYFEDIDNVIVHIVYIGSQPDRADPLVTSLFE